LNPSGGAGYPESRWFADVAPAGRVPGKFVFGYFFSKTESFLAKSLSWQTQSSVLMKQFQLEIQGKTSIRLEFPVSNSPKPPGKETIGNQANQEVFSPVRKFASVQRRWLRKSSSHAELSRMAARARFKTVSVFPGQAFSSLRSGSATAAPFAPIYSRGRCF
jgi:hypothetical protein